jgi:hypothetical protein
MTIKKINPEFLKQLIKLAAFLGDNIEDMTLEAHCLFLQRNLTIKELNDAISLYVQDGNVFYPKNPQNLLDLIKTKITSDDFGVSASTLILKAIRRHGTHAWTKAKKDLEDDIIEVIEALGGWSFLCETITNKNLNIYMAQIRECAKVVFNKNKNKNKNIQLIMFEGKKNDKLLDV